MDKSKPSNSQTVKIQERRIPSVKRSRSISSFNSNTEILHAAEDPDLAGATSKIRHQIVKWQVSQSNTQLRQLRQHKDYKVVVELSSKEGVSYTATIVCKMCNKRIHLNVD